MKAIPLIRVFLALVIFLVMGGNHGFGQLQQVWSEVVDDGGQIRSMAFDGQGNINVGGTAFSDLYAAKYSQSGTQIWHKTEGEAFENGGVVKADESGNVWVAGTTSTNPNSFEDHPLLVKYNPVGERLWSQTYTQRFVRGPFFLELDGEGNAYIASFFQSAPGPSPRFAGLVLKYSTGGQLLWAREFLPTNGGNVFITGLAVDGGGAVVISGYSWQPDAGSSTLLLKYETNGELAWRDSRQYGTSENILNAVALDAEGNPHVTGRALSGELVAKYSRDGTKIWHKLQNAWSPAGMDIEVNNLGEVLVATMEYRFYCYDKEGEDCVYFYSHLLSKFNASGEKLWSAHHYADDNTAPVLKVDGQRNAYVKSNQGLRKYSAGGTMLWEIRLPMTVAGFDFDEAGNVYAFGSALSKYVEAARPGAPVVEATNLVRRVRPGETVTLRASIEGDEPLSYQWFHFSNRAFSLLTRGTNSVLTLTNIDVELQGTYFLVVSNETGTSTSPDFQIEVVGLRVAGAPSVLAGATASMCGETAGSIGFVHTWQWSYNGEPLPGETNICLYIENIGTNQAGGYSLSGTSSEGTFFSEVFNLEVRHQAPELFTLNPDEPFSLLVDDSLRICANFLAGPPAQLQWRFNGLDIPGETNGCIFIERVNTNHSGFYSVAATNIIGGEISPSVEVTVNLRAPEGTIVFETGRTNILDGGNVTLCANVTGGPRPAFQWQFNNMPLPGETNECLRIISAGTNRAGLYRLLASNSVGVLVTPAITLTIAQQIPVFNNAPVPEQNVVEGGSAYFMAYALGGPPPLYFLQRNGTNLPLAYSSLAGLFPEFRLLGVTLDDQGDYTLLASNVLGMATSAVSRLNVTPARPLDRWTQRNPLPQSLPLLSVIYGSNLWVAAGEQGTILTSSNGIDWALQTRRSHIDYVSLACGDGLYVVAGTSGGILTSPDGTNWTQRFSPVSALSGITYGGGKFVAVGNFQGLPLVITSTNGIQWQPHPIDGFLPMGIAFGEGKFVAAGMGFVSPGAIATSTDGVNWNLNALLFPDNFENVIFGGGRFIAVGNNGSIFASVDGESWASATTGSGRRFIDAAYGNGIYVAAGTRGTIMTSPDGLAWSAQNSGTPDRMEGVAFGNGLFVALGENGTTITSTDGTNWQRRNFGTTRDLDGMTVAFGKIVIAGKNGVILTSSDGINFTHQVTGTIDDLHGITCGNGLLVAVGEPGTIITSADAISWTRQESGTSNSLKRAIYGGGQWIAVGTEGTVLTSPDGIDWTTRPLPEVEFGPYDLNAVAHGDGMYVIAADGPSSQNGSSYYSADGVNWTLNTHNFDKNLRAVIFADGKFLATANDSYLFVSTNGISWNARLSGWGGNLREALFTNGFWTVVGNFGSILTSTNTFDWKVRPTPTTENLHQVVSYNGRLVAIGNRGTILQSGRYIPSLNSFSFNQSTGAEMVFAGVAGEHYKLQASSDLMEWTDLTNFVNASEAMTFQDQEGATNGYRFYRLSRE